MAGYTEIEPTVFFAMWVYIAALVALAFVMFYGIRCTRLHRDREQDAPPSAEETRLRKAALVWLIIALFLLAMGGLAAHLEDRVFP